MSNVKKNTENSVKETKIMEHKKQGFIVAPNLKLKLEEYTSILRSCADNIRSNYVTIGTYLLKIKNEKLIVTTDGWQNFVNDVLNMSIPTAYRIMSTVEKFYNPKSLETDPEVIAKLEGFKDSTISRLLPLGDYETIKGAIIDGTFTTEMSAREVTEKVAAIIDKKKKIREIKSLPKNRRKSLPTEKSDNYDSEVYKFVNDMISATSLIDVQNRAKEFLKRWFK